MSDQTTPSQAEGERDDDRTAPERQSPPHPTPSQAEGEREEEPTTDTGPGTPGAAS
ncbi:hypothetical protein ACLGIH_23565 [Streptomyces sp. HMX87]|uniref:hypothetical protein n=1 Tax=Streptomyces sp. HMX87 TaxID=3390849 RepID=UPI003A8B37DC